MADNTPELINRVADYYSQKINEHGATPAGVDWNSEASQHVRFEQLSRVINTQDGFTMADLGCGYAAYYDYLSEHYSNFTYRGYDVSNDMCEAAQSRLKEPQNATFVCTASLDTVADYTTASGIFNVRLQNSESDWRDYIIATLDQMHEHSSQGFSFNCLTSFSDADRMRDDLYYADPAELFTHCKQRYSRNVALLHDYDLYEFTLLVRK